MKQLSKEQLNARYQGLHCLVFDVTHPDNGKKCAFVEMVRKPLQKRLLMKVEIMAEKRMIELAQSQVFIIVGQIPMPSVKDN